MNFQIKHRWTGAVLFSCELSAEMAAAEYSLQLGFAVRKAVSGGSDLRDSDLRDSDLRGSDLSGIDLSGSDLSGSDLRGIDLSGIDLSEEQRNSANFDPITPEEIARLDQVREIVLAKPHRLKMDTWHSGEWDATHTPEEEHSCGSAHCIAGWLQALSPDPEIRNMEPVIAGRKLAPASTFMFYTTDDTALAWLEAREYAKAVQP